MKYKKKYAELRDQMNIKRSGRGGVMRGGVNPRDDPFGIGPNDPIAGSLVGVSANTYNPSSINMLVFKDINPLLESSLQMKFLEDLRECSKIVNTIHTHSGGADTPEQVLEKTLIMIRENMNNIPQDLAPSINKNIEIIRKNISDGDQKGALKRIGLLRKEINVILPKQQPREKSLKEDRKALGKIANDRQEADITMKGKDVYSVLTHILETRNRNINFKKSVSLKITISTLLTDESVYMINVHGNDDALLNYLGKLYSFPRGFPIIWIPGKLVKMHGFLPKFENDKTKQESDITEFNGLKKMTMFKKWSGYLGQLCVFTYAGNIYWSATSKNSASNDFAYDAIRLFKKYINHNLLNYLLDKNLHICAEMLSKNDQSHGHIISPEKETPVVTVIASGNLCDLHKREYKGEPSTFIRPLAIYDVGIFCRKYKLPCDTGIIIENKSGIEQFITNLQKHRDFMTDTLFESIIKHPDGTSKISGVFFNPGSISHQDLVGDALEGLVLMLEHENGTKETKKYKFPIYTIRTMLIRDLFGSAKKERMAIEAYLETPKAKEKISDYMKNWVGEEGKVYWMNYFNTCMNIYTTPEFKTILRNFENCYKLGEREPTPEGDRPKCIGVHILLAEEAFRTLGKVPGKNVENPRHPRHQQHPRITAVTTQQSFSTKPLIIGFFGPIGSGKTTAMKKFCTWASGKYPHKQFVPIDGDVMGLTNMEMMNFGGSEKNDYLKYLIVQQLILGNIPVVSQGGHVFGEILYYANKVLQVKPEIVLCQMVIPSILQSSDGDGDGDGGGGSKELLPNTLRKTNKFIDWAISDPDNKEFYIKNITESVKRRLHESYEEYNETKSITGWNPSSEKTYTTGNIGKNIEKEAIKFATEMVTARKPPSDERSLGELDSIKLGRFEHKYNCGFVNPVMEINFSLLENILPTLLENANKIPSENIKFTQRRYLVKYWDKNQNQKGGEWLSFNPRASSIKFGHITLDYNPNGVEIFTELITDSSHTEKNTTPLIEIPLHIAKSVDKKNEIRAIVLGKIDVNSSVKDHERVKNFNVKTGEKPKYLHITVKAMPTHSNEQMNLFSEHIFESKTPPLILDTQNKKPPQISYANFSNTPYMVRFYKPYYF
jgi:hypothetical protein